MNKAFVFFALTLSFAILGQACQTPQPSQVVEDSANTYFPLSAFVQSQVSALRDNGSTKVAKKVIFDGKVERQKLQIKDWEKELGVFMKADINKAGLRNSYQRIDSVTSQGAYKIYRALEPQLKVRELCVLQNLNGEVVDIRADVRQQNALYSEKQTLVLHCKPDKQGRARLASYRIESIQDIALKAPNTFVLEADLLD
ncbi:hypothetical protein [Eisenibacter elegans]|jgi:hypothetical protein|uniref:hypothetical protein n=1 Tax=Eisenibacter elegans TaxID=997 RepID=UPI000401F348|nr:hypothetical protein [Eisenibacter elegans]